LLQYTLVMELFTLIPFEGSQFHTLTLILLVVFPVERIPELNLIVNHLFKGIMGTPPKFIPTQKVKKSENYNHIEIELARSTIDQQNLMPLTEYKYSILNKSKYIT
jgi:hypothetical protein